VSSTSCWSRSPASSRSRMPPCGGRYPGPSVTSHHPGALRAGQGPLRGRRGDRGAVRRAALAAISRSWHNRLHYRFRLDASASKDAAHAPGSDDEHSSVLRRARRSLRHGEGGVSGTSASASRFVLICTTRQRVGGALAFPLSRSHRDVVLFRKSLEAAGLSVKQLTRRRRLPAADVRLRSTNRLEIAVFMAACALP
jgi:hypothetical protein